MKCEYDFYINRAGGILVRHEGAILFFNSTSLREFVEEANKILKQPCPHCKGDRRDCGCEV